jgi:hypothetical protein
VEPNLPGAAPAAGGRAFQLLSHYPGESPWPSSSFWQDSSSTAVSLLPHAAAQQEPRWTQPVPGCKFCMVRASSMWGLANMRVPVLTPRYVCQA